MLERYFIPLAPYALAALGLLVCMFLTVATGSEIRRLKSTLRGRRANEASVGREIEIKVAELSERLRETEDRTGIISPPVLPQSGLNVNKRSQVLRLARRGERPENIAALLGLPRREVELLLKVHALAASGSGTNS
jgi:hypothetical protein